MTNNKKHIFLPNSAESTLFTSTSRGGGKSKFPPRDPARHGAFIKRKLENAWEESQAQHAARSAIAVPTRHGTYLEFESAPGFDLQTKSFGIMHQ